MYIPKTTYRIQFTAAFSFKDLESQIPYLEKLGIDTLYASPVFKAQPGSTHGYDVTDFSKINPELGTEEDFLSLTEKIQSAGMGWIQDIVPNHMAFSLENEYLYDVLKNGRQSQYASLFDIYWDHHRLELKDKLMVPVLGEELHQVIENEELSLSFVNSDFVLKYYEKEFPVNSQSIEEFVKEKTDRSAMQKICALFNNNPVKLEELAHRQHYLLCHWQATEKKINYRRFFTINDLICVKQEDPETFEMTHRLIAEYIEKGYFQGVRVDHIDGLLKPTEYLERLRKLLGPDTYILVEKILAKGEMLPEEWPIQGTTGYEYLGMVNELLINRESRNYFDGLYHDYIGGGVDFQSMVKRKKRFILKQRMAGELDNLLDLLDKSSATFSSDLNYKEAVTTLLCDFPVYRSYAMKLNENAWKNMYDEIASSHSELKNEFEELKKVFSLKSDSDLEFVLRFQQLSGPLAAKGVEDTAFYQFNRFICQNEVGDEPHDFGIQKADFHAFIEERKGKWPLGMNASSTHDTKRGEDARARLAAISNDPPAWEDLVKKLDASLLGKSIPVPNDRYMIIQSVVGAWPFDDAIDDAFNQRLLEFLQKALREGKNQTSWASPNQQYEKTCFAYLKKLLNDPETRSLLSSFVHKISRNGLYKSISATILKFTLPGIPDIYQGCESWNLSLVDPDNRQPVDFPTFNATLDTIHVAEKEKRLPEFLDENWKQIPNDIIKIFVTLKLVQLRRKASDLLIFGDYIPGETDEKSISFLRKHRKNWLWVWLPLEERAKLGPGNHALPEDAPKKWKDVFTNQAMEAGKSEMDFPFICWEGME